MSAVTAPQRLIKQPAEVLKMAVDYVNLLASSESLSSVSSVSADSTTITVGAGAISGTQVQFVVSGGTDGRTYRIEVITVTSTSNTREIDGLLTVVDE